MGIIPAEACMLGTWATGLGIAIPGFIGICTCCGLATGRGSPMGGITPIGCETLGGLATGRGKPAGAPGEKGCMV